jgi:autotransporter-associated beta strand protein
MLSVSSSRRSGQAGRRIVLLAASVAAVSVLASSAEAAVIVTGQNVITGPATLGASTRDPGGTALFDVAGGTISGTFTLTNTILPWGVVQNGSAYNFATVSGGNVVAYTAGSAQSGTGAWGGIASGDTNTVNYDITSNTAVLGSTGLLRTVNSIRYTGTGSRQPGNNAGTLLATKAIMNAGSGVFTVGRNSANITNDFSFAIAAGAGNELVLAPMSANIELYSFIVNGSAASTVTVVGGSNRTVLLAGPNTYTGPTYVNSGTLQVASGAATNGTINASSGITINGTGAKYLHTSSTAGTVPITLTRGSLDGTAGVGAVTVADLPANVVANGNLTGTTALTTASLTFQGDATLNLRRTASTVGVAVTGALATTPANGTVTVNVNGAFTNGLNNLVSYGSFGGSASDFTLGTLTGLGPRQSAGALSLSGNNLAVTVNGESIAWSGAASGNWTTATTGDNTGPNNWATLTAETATNFWAGDLVSFNDAYDVTPGVGGSTPVSVSTIDISAANVSPGSTTFNNSAVNYTVGSSGGFGIAAGTLAKSGSGSLRLSTANTYAGGSTLNAGTLVIDNASAIGTGALTINGGTLNAVASTTLSTNNAVNVAGDFAFTGSADLNLGTGSVTLSGGTRAIAVNAGTLTVGRITNAGGGLTKTGAGTLQVNPTAGNSSLAGTLTVSAGTVGIGLNDFTVTGLAGTGTIQNGSATNRWFFVNTTGGSSVFDGSFQDGGTGRLGLNVNGGNTLTVNGAVNLTDRITVNGATTKLVLNGASTSTTAASVFLEVGGALELRNATALAAGTLINLNGQQTASVLYATDGGDNAYQFGGSSGSTLNVTLDRATPGASVTHNMSTPTLGGGLGGTGGSPSGPFNFNLIKGANVSGTATASFDRFNLGGGGGGQTIINPAAGVVVTIGTVTKSNNNTEQALNLGGVTTGNSITGAITDGAATVGLKINLIKSNTSTWTLLGDSTYSGGTAVTGGTLLVNNVSGSGTGAGAVNVSTGGTLGGSGTIAGAVTIASDGILSPGNSPGTLTLGSSLTVNGTLLEEVAHPSADLTIVSGSVTLGGTSVLSLPLTNTYDPATTYTLVTYGGSLTGTFFSVIGLPASHTLSYGSGTASAITLVPVPEPTVLAGLLGAASLVLRRRTAK